MGLHGELVGRVLLTDIVPPLELRDVAVQVLRTHPVERSVVRHASDVLAGAVLHVFVVRQSLVGRGFVGVDGGTGPDYERVDEALKRGLVRAPDDLRADAFAVAVLHADDW